MGKYFYARSRNDFFISLVKTQRRAVKILVMDEFCCSSVNKYNKIFALKWTTAPVSVTSRKTRTIFAILVVERDYKN